MENHPPPPEATFPAALPSGFLFSQSNLQDYADCRRRFLLRHVLRLPWPAVESEPPLESERHLQAGEHFHRLAQQFFCGVPAEQLVSSVQDEPLRAWWQAFLPLAHDLRQRGSVWAELTLSVPLEGFRLVAKFDTVVRTPEGRFTIYDWKTTSRPPPRTWLAGRLQTRLYPYLLTRAGGGLKAGEALSPSAVEMVYWFATHPHRTQIFPYSEGRFQEDHAFLSGMVQEIRERTARLFPAPDPALPAYHPLPFPDATQMDMLFPKTRHEQRCAFCVYRSLCRRGTGAAPLEEGEEIEEEIEEWEEEISSLSE